MIWTMRHCNKRREWVSDNGKYVVTEILSRQAIREPMYFCYRIVKDGESYLAVRYTPELAKELCELYEGKQ